MILESFTFSQITTAGKAQVLILQITEDTIFLQQLQV